MRQLRVGIGAGPGPHRPPARTLRSHADQPLTPPTQCGSGLAREDGVSVNTCADWYTVFASKPAPTF
ncbi:hypothetical protein GDV60_00625 [Pseudomonas sp. DTU12.1]|nr:hypothetical protein GDV60_00625 [Pseudomonas sp. DTU12.1]